MSLLAAGLGMTTVTTMATMATVGPAAAAEEPRRPKLVVVLVVDQMRADYIDKFQHQWKDGLQRMVTQGAWWRLAAYPYLNTWTCCRSCHDRNGQLSGEPWSDPQQLVGPRLV